MRYQFRVCLNPACRFRYPAQVDPGGIFPCPRCRAETSPAADVATVPENILDPIFSGHSPLSALLDNLRSTWNVGSILRTADGVGMSRVYLCGITPPATHPRVTRTALGAENSLNWSWHPNALDQVEKLLAEGCQLWALETIPGADPITSAPRPEPADRIVLVIGNEITGIDPEILPLCSRTYWIPMVGIKRSLNAAVAFGIAAYFLTQPPEFRHQNEFTDPMG